MTEYICGTDSHDGNWLTGEEVTRCRDCRHYDTNDETQGGKRWCFFHSRYSFPDGYCSWGERK